MPKMCAACYRLIPVKAERRAERSVGDCPTCCQKGGKYRDQPMTTPCKACLWCRMLCTRNTTLRLQHLREFYSDSSTEETRVGDDSTTRTVETKKCSDVAPASMPRVIDVTPRTANSRMEARKREVERKRQRPPTPKNLFQEGGKTKVKRRRKRNRPCGWTKHKQRVAQEQEQHSQPPMGDSNMETG